MIGIKQEYIVKNEAADTLAPQNDEHQNPEQIRVKQEPAISHIPEVIVKREEVIPQAPLI